MVIFSHVTWAQHPLSVHLAGWLAGCQPAFTWMEEGYLEYLGCVFQLAWPCAFRPSPVPLFPRIPVPQDSSTERYGNR